VEIPASLDSVRGSERCTVLGRAGERVALVEHLLAALHIRGFWRDVVVEVSAEELPVLDGSAGPWLASIEQLGVPPSPPSGLHSNRTLAFTQGPSSFTLNPGPSSLCVAIEFKHPAIGRQRWCGGPECYHELLGARTFGFLHEVEDLHRRGLAIGGSLENAIVFDERGPLRPLRCADEPVRHKALDVLGDFFLLGRPLVGGLVITRGSHQSHVTFMRKLLTTLAPTEGSPS